MKPPSDREIALCKMFESFCVTAIRNYSRNLKRAMRNRQKHDGTGEESVEYLIGLLSAEDKYASVLIWYEDFQDYGALPASYWTTLSGKWSVWRSDEYSESRVYSQLEGYGELAWKYDEFSDVHLRAQLILPSGFTGRAGIFLGSLFCCVNYDAQRIELYEGNTLKGSYSASFSRTADADLRTSPTVYTLEFRKRGNRVRVYAKAA